MLEHAMRDLRYAIRILVKRPILLATTTISIGVGVGINAAVFSVLRAVLFQGPTAHAPDDLFNVKPGLSYLNYVDVRANDAFVDLAARQASTLTYRTGDSTTTIGAQVVSDNFFEVLGLHAVHGRTFGADSRLDTIKDANVVVISYGFWQRLGGDQTVIGRTLYLKAGRTQLPACCLRASIRCLRRWCRRACTCRLALGSTVASKTGAPLNSTLSGDRGTE